MSKRRPGKVRRIFERARLRPTQLRTVAQPRFGDASCLRNSRDNERANGGMYLGGFVIECLLKAKLLEASPCLQSAGHPDAGPRSERHRWSLCYRSHDLDVILAELPDLQDRLALLEQRGQARVLQSLRSICAQWTIFARYSPRMAMMSEAGDFLDRVEELKEWLK